MRDVLLPRVGKGILSGTLIKWLKNPGDRVDRGEPLFEISTRWIDTKIPAPVAGQLFEVLFAEGETVAVNAIVCRINEVEVVKERIS